MSAKSKHNNTKNKIKSLGNILSTIFLITIGSGFTSSVFASETKNEATDHLRYCNGSYVSIGFGAKSWDKVGACKSNPSTVGPKGVLKTAFSEPWADWKVFCVNEREYLGGAVKVCDDAPRATKAKGQSVPQTQKP